MNLPYVRVVFFILINVAPSNISQNAAFWAAGKSTPNESFMHIY